MQRWERELGVEFLQRIGLRSGQTVLDFGARVGHYSIPAAIAVGKTGLVYALDKEQSALDELDRKARKLKLRNITIIHTTGSVELAFETGSIDVVLLYDVLHYFNSHERAELYSEIFRVLKPDGLLSVYPKHVLEDFPMDKFDQVQFEDVKQEIVKSNFQFREKYCGTLSHDNFLNQGCVLNFTK
jgi:ubiquinone/menaquinone biosynthesis C-methylase UbiE